MNLWPWQERCGEELAEAIDGGAKSVVVTGPTGSGKTIEMIRLIEWCNERRWPCALFTNRRLLLEQTKERLEAHGIHPGMRAAGYETAYLRDVQLAMFQSEISRVYNRKDRSLHPARVVIADECHLSRSGQSEKLLRDYMDQGAAIVGFTATPLDLGDLYSELIVAGTNSECREHGALVAAQTYAPDEPDLKHVKRYMVGEDLTETQNVQAMMRPGIFGRVFKHWDRLNPERKPTILFAPGVKESLWFAEQFVSSGIRAAHIDGQDCWSCGEFGQGPLAREKILAEFKAGDISVVCNRFVLREGIDIPSIGHAIFACVFGSLSSYIQSGGRALRAAPGKEDVTIQDHGGNWHRHGSLNSDRDWSLGQTNTRTVGERIERLREKREAQPICCPNCGKVRSGGKVCSACGHQGHINSRMVVQIDGNLREITGDFYKPRRVATRPDTERLWLSMYHRMKRANRTFRQAEALFFVENHYYPPRTLPRMPVSDGDWWCKISDVPMERLRSEQFERAAS